MDPRAALELRLDPLIESETPDLNQAAALALDRHPTLRAARSIEEADRQVVKAAKADRWPSLSLFGNYSYSDVFSLDEPTDENTQWNYGARLSMNIFDGLLTKSNIRRAEASLVTSRSSAESAERDVILGVRRAVLEVEVAKESIAVTQEAVRSSEEDLRLAEERYKVGEGTILEVIDAQVNLTRAKTDRVNAHHDHRLALSALRNAVGDAPAPELDE
jgi:outer membrane protein TolC